MRSSSDRIKKVMGQAGKQRQKEAIVSRSARSAENIFEMGVRFVTTYRLLKTGYLEEFFIFLSAEQAQCSIRQ